MRVLGIDYGSARTGLALGDTESRIASPWGVITEADRLSLIARIHEVVARDLVEAIVVGVPKPLKDTKRKNAQVREIEAFIEDLNGLGLPIHEVNEALSSRLAARQMVERGQSGKRDDLAAANILQTWLDRS